jgi:hypothetical protein
MERVRVVAEFGSEITQYLALALIFELLAGASFGHLYQILQFPLTGV